MFGHPLCAGFCARPRKQEELAATQVRCTGARVAAVLVPNTSHSGERVMFPVAPEGKATPVGTLPLFSSGGTLALQPLPRAATRRVLCDPPLHDCRQPRVADACLVGEGTVR